MDAIGRQDAWLTVGGCPVFTFDPAGPLYLVEFQEGAETLSAWSLGEPRPLMELAGRLRLGARAQQVQRLDETLAVYCWRAGEDTYACTGGR